MIGTWLAAARLCGAIVATWGVPADRACPAALAIVEEHGRWSPELIGAIVYHESRFDPRATTGVCHGLMQVKGGPRRGVLAQIRAGVAALELARAWCGRRALWCYASGRPDRGGASVRAFGRLQRQLMGAPRRVGKAES